MDALSSIFFNGPFGLNIRVNNLILNPHKYGRRKVNANTNYSDIFWTISNCIYKDIITVCYSYVGIQLARI